MSHARFKFFLINFLVKFPTIPINMDDGACPYFLDLQLGLISGPMQCEASCSISKEDLPLRISYLCKKEGANVGRKHKSLNGSSSLFILDVMEGKE